MQDIEAVKKRIESDNNELQAALSELSSTIDKSKEVVYNKLPQGGISAPIRELLNYMGVQADKVPEEISDSVLQLDYLLSPSGIKRRRVELTGEWWKDSTGALLGSTIEGEPVALLPRGLWGYKYYDQEKNKRVRVNKENSKSLSGDAFCFYHALPAKKINLFDLFKFMLKGITRSDLLLILGISLLVSLLGMLTPYINKQIFDSVIPSGTRTDIFPVAGLLIGAAIGTASFQITRSLFLMKIRDKINILVQSAIMSRIFALPTSFYKNFSAGELSGRVMSISMLSDLLSDTVIATGLTVLFSFVYIFQMASYAPSLLLPGLLMLLLMLIYTISLNLVQQRLSNKQLKASVKMNGLLYGLFGGIQKVKLAGAEKRAFAKWATAYKKQVKLIYIPPRLLRMDGAISGALIFGGTILLYYTTGLSQVSISDFIAFNMSYTAVSGAIMSLAEVMVSLSKVKPILEMVKPILEEVQEYDSSKLQVSSIAGNIELSNVSFQYTKEGPIILNNLNLQIDPGEYIAIVGSSGSGKSTLMRLLLGFEKPDSGAVYYDGNDLNDLDVRSVRQRIGTCLQNGSLFAGDIFANIIINAPWSTMEDAWSAAAMAGLDEDIKAMPMGMHTVISEGSGSISGGQRQRILIARALVGKPQVLFFDEATSALDNLTQRMVSDSLDSLCCTRLVIAHRLSTVINCDRIIVLDKGRVVEDGSYEVLMKQRGLFYDLAIRQISETDELN